MLRSKRLDELNLEDKAKEFDKLIDCSNENNSSAIILFQADDNKLLFTADAGPEALEKVVKKYDLKELDFLDVPHHESKNNLTTNLMDIFSPKTVCISCVGEHPDPYIVHYLKSKGTMIYTTKTHGQLRHRNILMNAREEWYALKPL